MGIGDEGRRRVTSPRIGEIVAAELRRQIVNGELADGDLLPRQEVLVEHFNVSLVSLREALRILQTEGLISVRRGNQGGAVVHAPTKASAAFMLGLVLQSGSVRLDDLGAALHAIEPTCVGLAAGRPDRAKTLIPQLRKINQAMDAELADGAAFTKIGRQFHDQIVHGCGNQTMIAVVGTLEALWTGHEQRWAEETAARGEYPSLKDRRAVLNAHLRMTDLIEAGDVERARKVATKHLADAQTYVLSGDPEQRIFATPPAPLADLRG